MESVALAGLVQAIEARTGQPLEPAAILAHPTVRALSGHLAAMAGPPAGGHPGQLTGIAARPARGHAAGAPDRIAIVGMSGRLPGAPDLDTWWQLLRAGRCAITEVPPSR